MLNLLRTLLSSSPFVPHGHCYLWKTGLVWLNIISDALIGLSYYSIPLLLVYIVRKRGDLPFDWLFFLIGSFIVACGTGHLMDIWTLWHPTYWLSGTIKALTATVSVATGVALVSLIPKILALPSPAQLAEANQRLEQQATARQQVEVALRQSQQTLELVIDTFPQRVFWKDQNFRYLGCNRLFAQDAGLESPEQILGRDDFDLDWKELAHLYRADDEFVLSQRASKVNHEEPRVSQDGTAWVRMTKIPLQNDAGDVIGLFGSYEDISDRKQAEIAIQQSKEAAETALQNLRQAQHHLIQSEKMSSLGQLVAGVAHEINNPISFIYGNIVPANHYVQDLFSLLALYQQHYSSPVAAIQQRLDEIDIDFLSEDLPKLLGSMRVGAERIHQIVLSLRNFSRLDETGVKAVNLHDGIESTIVILTQRLQGIRIIRQYGDLPKIECQPAQLNQVFMNLLMNAIEALASPNLPIKEITIHSDRINETEIQLQIRDNGCGMLSSIQTKVFDPFFTTKPVGQGTGLGLSIVYQIVENHSGKIEVTSEPNSGTVFTLQLPITQPDHVQQDRQHQIARTSV
jgi:PAS domain S-box-containing protein